MNENHEPTAEAGSEEDVVGRLLHLAGPRPAAAENVFQQVREVAHAAWRAKVHAHAARRRARRRAYGQLAIAATLVLALGASFLLWQKSGGGVGRQEPVAMVAALHGEAWLLPAGQEAAGEPLRLGGAISAGAKLATGPEGRLALHLASGGTARLDRGSRLVLTTATTVTTTVLALERGAVYLDSGDGPGKLEVRTPLGVARDVGTQFEMRLLDDGLHLQVREGAVELEHRGTTHAAPAGTALTLSADGSLERHAAASHGEGWDWILDVSPGFELEGRTVAELLGWVVRETGWQLTWADDGARQKAALSVAHGSIAGLAPGEALDVVLPGSGLTHRIEDGRLVVASAGR